MSRRRVQERSPRGKFQERNPEESRIPISLISPQASSLRFLSWNPPLDSSSSRIIWYTAKNMFGFSRWANLISYTAFDPQSMVNFGCIGARFMPDFRFEKLFSKCLPGKSFFYWLQRLRCTEYVTVQQGKGPIRVILCFSYFLLCNHNRGLNGLKPIFFLAQAFLSQSLLSRTCFVCSLVFGRVLSWEQHERFLLQKPFGFETLQPSAVCL